MTVLVFNVENNVQK